MCHTSARFDEIILITRILTDTRRSNVKKNVKIWLKNQNSAQAGQTKFLEKEKCTNEKAEQTFFTTPACTYTACSKVF